MHHLKSQQYSNVIKMADPCEVETTDKMGLRIANTMQAEGFQILSSSQRCYMK